MSEEAERGTSEQAESARPALRIVKGDPTPEEVAAMVAVVGSLGGGAAPAPKPVKVWAHPSRLLRSTYPSGPGGWRSSGLPR